MRVGGPLELAGFELAATDPTTELFKGRQYYNTVEEKLKVYNGTTWVISSGSGGLGEKNYITNSSGEVNVDGWGESAGGQVDVTRSTTAAELPREFTTETGVKIIGTGSTGTDEHVYYRFSLDDVDQARKLKIAFSQKPISGYATGELTVEMYYHDQPTYTGGAGYTQLTVENNDITDVEGDALYTFDTDSTGIYYELRINKPAAATNNGVVISDVIVGPGKVIPGSVVTEWEEFTPEFRNDTGLTFSFTEPKIRRVGGSMELRVTAGVTAGPGTDAADLELVIPNNLTAFYPSLTGTLSHGPVVLVKEDTSPGDFNELAYSWTPTSALDAVIFAAKDPVSGVLTSLDGTDFGTTNNHYRSLLINISIPIDEWQGSASANFINDEVAAQNARFRASSNAGATITNGNVIDFEDLEYIEGGGSESAGVYTVPSDGKYRVRSQIRFATGSTTAPTVIDIRKNAALTVRGVTDTTVTQQPTITVEGIVDCSSGDTIDIAYSGDATSPALRAVPADNFLEIVRVPDFTAGQAVSFGQATETEYGLVTKNKWQEYVYTGATKSSSSGVLKTFNNLVIGKTYRVTLGLAGFHDSADDTNVDFALVFASHDSNIVAYKRIGSASNADIYYIGENGIFTATTTTVTFEWNTSGTAGVYGSAGAEQTKMYLEELNNYGTETTDFD